MLIFSVQKVKFHSFMTLIVCVRVAPSRPCRV